MKKVKLFEKEFLDKLESKDGAKQLFDYSINTLGMKFTDAIINISKHFNIECLYFEEKTHEPLDNGGALSLVIEYLKNKEKEKL